MANILPTMNVIKENSMNIPNPIINTNQNKSLNGKASEFATKAKDFISEEKESIESIGSKAYDEVESMASDVLKQVKEQFSTIMTSSLSLIRKNPLITIAAAVTVGLVIAKMLSKTDVAGGSRKHEETSAHH